MKPIDHADRDDAQPLGPPIRKAPPEKAQGWFQVPDKPGIERDQEGRLRTNFPENRAAQWQARGPRYVQLSPYWRRNAP